MALRVGSTVSESDIVLAQCCQSAPTQLVTRTTECFSTRDAGQQTSDTQLMPTAAVTETVWTLCEPDAEAMTPAAAEAAVAKSQHHDKLCRSRTMKVASADTDTNDRSSKVTITTDQTDKEETLLAALNKQPTTDADEHWSTSATGTTTAKVCISAIMDCIDKADVRYPKTSTSAFKEEM